MFPAKFSRGIKLLCTELNLYQVTNQWVEPNVVRLGPTRISSYQPILCAQKNAAIKFDKVYIPALSGRACVAIVLPLFSPFLFANEPIQAKNTTWKGMISNCSDLLSFCSLCSVFAFFFGNKPMSQPWKDRPCNRSYKTVVPFSVPRNSADLNWTLQLVRGRQSSRTKLRFWGLKQWPNEAKWSFQVFNVSSKHNRLTGSHSLHCLRGVTGAITDYVL